LLRVARNSCEVNKNPKTSQGGAAKTGDGEGEGDGEGVGEEV